MTAYQSHSATSKEAAQHDFTSQKQAAYLLIAKYGDIGRTGKEIASSLEIPIGSAAARLRALQIETLIRKSHDVRDGNSVWKLPELVPFEADTKADRAKEALALVNILMKRATEEQKEVLTLVYEVLK